MLKPLLERLLLAYGLGLPYHRGKWRVVESLYTRAGLASLYGNGPVEVSRNGVRWRLDPRSLVQRALYFLGSYEIHETRWLLGVARPEWTMLDVGANFGYYSLRVSQVTGGRARVHAFEPELGMFTRLEGHARANGFTHLTPHRLALSASDGELELVAPSASNEGVGHLRTAGDGGSASLQRIPSLRMDSFAAREGLTRVDFIKIDVEGAEGLVLAGAAETLARFRPTLMVEINPEALRGFGVTAAALLDTLRGHRYDLFTAEAGGLRPLAAPPPEDGYVNAICLPR